MSAPRSWRALAAAVLLAALACGSSVSREEARPGLASNSQPRTHLQIDGTTFRTPDGRPFQWRGITAFRLLDFIADRQEGDARRFLAWAQSRKLTLVRVLAMGGGFMELKPQDGRMATSRLLTLAGEYGLHVELVALAGTLEMPVSLDEQLTALGEVLGAHPNGLLEVANEPTHPSQAPAVGRTDVLLALAARVPSDVPVALGSIEADESFAKSDYATWHAPRDTKLDGWAHVLGIAQGAAYLQKFRKPVVSDEPIGAGPKYEAGRRDDTPARFRAAALLTRLAGLGATFHYEGGLQARIPEGRELECFEAWNEAWTLLPGDVESQGTFAMAGAPGAAVRDFDRKASLGVFERSAGNRGWVLSVGPGDPALSLAPGWSASETKTFEGARLITVAR